MAEKEGSGVARGAPHTVHVLPHAPYVISRFLAPALERVAPDAESTQLLVITADDETSLAVAEVARAISDRSAAPVVPLTGAARAARILGGRTLPAIAASPATLVALLKTSAVKLGEVRTVVVAWADELFAAREDEALEVVLAEVPKEAARIVVTARMTPEIEALVERHLRRARRVGGAETPSESVGQHPVRFVVTASSTRRAALRRLLDEVDPPSAFIVARDDRSEQELRDTLSMLGYADDDPNVRVVRGDTAPSDAEAKEGDEGAAEGAAEAAPTVQAALVVLYDLPTSAAELTRAVSGAAQVVALVTPRQLPTLRSLTSGAVEPMELSPTAAKARGRDERVRAAIRTELQGSFPAREVIALEPLLAEFDGLEIAAAALRIVERERAEARARRQEAERAAAIAAATGGPVARAPETDFTRLFMSIGERDGVRASDLVGAIANEAGITSDKIGRIDVRESHSVAEVASSVAETVLEKINGITVRGRRITARVDERPARPREGAREGGRFGGREGGRPAGGERSGGREGGRGGFRDREGGGGSRGGFRDRDRAPRSGGGGGRFSREEGPPRERRYSRDEGERPRARRGADEGPPRGARGGFRDRERADDGRVPRATRERDEWTERADRVRNARRPRRGEE